MRVSISKRAAERAARLDMEAMPRDWFVRVHYGLDPMNPYLESPITDAGDDLLNMAEWQEGRSERGRHFPDD